MPFDRVVTLSQPRDLLSIVLYILITIQRIRDKYTIPRSGLGNPVISAAIRGRWSPGKLQGRIPRCLVNVIANHYRWSSELSREERQRGKPWGKTDDERDGWLKGSGREGTGSMRRSVRTPSGPLRHFPSSSRIFSFTCRGSRAPALEDLALVSCRHSCRESIKLQFTLGFNISLLLRGIGVTKRQKSLLFFKQSEIIRLTTAQREREREKESLFRSRPRYHGQFIRA